MQGSPCERNCHKVCPGTSFSSQITYMEISDGSGVGMPRGALLGGDDTETETAGRTNEWWHIDDSCQRRFGDLRSGRSGGFWVCPTNGHRQAVSVVLLRGSHPKGYPIKDAAQPSQWALDGTLYHFGSKERRLHLGFAGIANVIGPCCDIGWYMSLANGAVKAFSIFPGMMVQSGGLVLATSYPAGSVIHVQQCKRSWVRGKVQRTCVAVHKASSLQGIWEVDSPAFFVESSQGAFRFFLKINDPENGLFTIGGVQQLRSNRYARGGWFEVKSNKEGRVPLDIPEALPAKKL